MNNPELEDDLTPSQLITKHIEEIPGWRGEMLAKLRRLINDSSSELTEEWKLDTPVWSCKGNVVAAGTFKDHVKLNFFKGASLQDPKRLFNSGLEAKGSRGIDFSEGDEIDEPALKQLIRAAVAYNEAATKKK
jgi:hypothetical protein